MRLSGVLWLEVSGVFFGVFALLALGYLWKLRGALARGSKCEPSQPAERHRDVCPVWVLLRLQLRARKAAGTQTLTHMSLVPNDTGTSARAG